MNFLKALQHAFIGYGIRRKSWDEKAVLYFNYDKDSLHFLTGLGMCRLMSNGNPMA
jgi:hypothetical protein